MNVRGNGVRVCEQASRERCEVCVCSEQIGAVLLWAWMCKCREWIDNKRIVNNVVPNVLF